MPKKKRPDEKPAEQFKRFVDAARETAVDEKEAERAFKRIAKPEAKTSRPDDGEAR